MNEHALADETQRYQLGECIGRGGLGSVYRAWDGKLGRWVAVKRLATDPTLKSEEIQDKMRREANALAALQHPNVVTVHDFGIDEDGPFVVMEFIEGQTLDACVDNAPFDYASFLELAEQTLAGLGAAHRAGLLHRDLKPGNVMLAAGQDGAFQVKLLDFGLAKFAVHPLEQTVDQANALFGSIYFMAPEQFRRAPLDARTDLYALGCVFYYTLTCRHPFTGETVAAAMASHLQHNVRPLATLRPDLPEPVSEWVMRLLSLAPDDRPAGAAEALTSLRAQTHGRPHGVSPTGRGAAGSWRRRWLPGLWRGSLGVLAMAAALGLGGYLAWHRTVPLPEVSLVATVPVTRAQGNLPGVFTLARTGDRRAVLAVTYLIHGSAKNGVDYVEIPKTQTMAAGEATRKISIIPLDQSYGRGESRHVKLTLLPGKTYGVATPEEVKLKILYDR